MKRILFLFTACFCMGIGGCKKVECLIQNPFDNTNLSNYKCTKNCKTEAQLKANFFCVECVNSSNDTIQTCNIELADSLSKFYNTNPSLGKCNQIDVLVSCSN